jgi:hypothetical protein
MPGQRRNNGDGAVVSTQLDFRTPTGGELVEKKDRGDSFVRANDGNRDRLPSLTITQGTHAIVSFWLLVIGIWCRVSGLLIAFSREFAQ